MNIRALLCTQIKSFKMKILHKFFFILTCVSILTIGQAVGQKQFTVVLDAGHGGHDAGAIGTYMREKNINLAVSLKLGSLINENYPDVKVVYTRKTDVFIPLQRRADIANENHADIFISIHTNAVKSRTTFGTETFVLGLAKSKSNLEVAMKENAVITLEDDYKTKYQGFDPNSVDSYIMFEYMQDRYLDKSLQLATLIEDQFKRKKRYSRGVKQAGFWVLHKSACPSVLVELGFVSNISEEKFLSTGEGRDELADAIFKAFEAYKRDYDRKSGITPAAGSPVVNRDSDNVAKETIKVQEVPSDNVIFKIQLFALERLLQNNHSAFKGLKNVTYYKEGSFYKYTYGESTTFDEIEKTRKEIAGKFPSAYIIGFRGDKKITVSEAIKANSEK